MGRPIVVQVVVGRFGRRIHRRHASDEWKRTTEPPGALLTAVASVPTSVRSRSVDADDADDADEDVVKSSSLMRCITRRGTG